jgi:hypothetical protein
MSLCGEETCLDMYHGILWAAEYLAVSNGTVLGWKLGNTSWDEVHRNHLLLKCVNMPGNPAKSIVESAARCGDRSILELHGNSRTSS